MTLTWTVDYGNGPVPCTLPHAWRQDVSLEFEGPVTYRSSGFLVPSDARVRFGGVSYHAEVSAIVDRQVHPLGEHDGIWDAFEFDLSAFAGRECELVVRVIKNGGSTYPVRDVASGFLPYVFGTFGGIHRPVEVTTAPTMAQAIPPTRTSLDGHRVLYDGRPLYIRGVLHWGWYPELGHPSPSRSVIESEIDRIEKLGFNHVKFCLWVPPHEYFKALAERGLTVWLELPLWDPRCEPESLNRIEAEMGRIIDEYAIHPNIIAWTVGCELYDERTIPMRERLVRKIQSLTGCPLVKDNSGGAEMYSQNLRELGTFYDFHPYCDTPFYPLVLDSLRPGARVDMPILLGEFNDIDTHRDLPQIDLERPYWVSIEKNLNAQGVRWQYDLPVILENETTELLGDRVRSEQLRQSSDDKAAWMRKYVQEHVRSVPEIAGYVVTGIRDTPISTSGFFDDWDEPKPLPGIDAWNHADGFFLIPARRPPWIRGGNRPGFQDPYNAFAGPYSIRLGLRSEQGGSHTVRADLCADGRPVTGETWHIQADANVPTEVGVLAVDDLPAGDYHLSVRSSTATNSWAIRAYEPWSHALPADWRVIDPARLLDDLKPGDGPNLVVTGDFASTLESIRQGARAVWLLTGEGTLPMPFWRESAYEFADDTWVQTHLKNQWSRLLAISGDGAIDAPWLDALLEGIPRTSLLRRIDTRTYAEHDVWIEARVGTGLLNVTTLRPFGGLGVQPCGVSRNAFGAELMRHLLRRS